MKSLASRLLFDGSASPFLLTNMKAIDLLLEEQDLSVNELAARCGLGDERVLAIVDGRWLASPAERSAIAAALGVAVEHISWGHTISPRNVRYHRFGIKEEF